MKLTLVYRMDDDVWVVQVSGPQPRPAQHVASARTGATYRAEVAGSVDARAVVSGKMILRFYPVANDAPELLIGDVLTDASPTR